MTETIVASTGAPADPVHVLTNEVSDTRYAVAGVLLRDRMPASTRPE